MILYTGGSYQGKLKALLKDTEYTEDDVYDFAKINIREYSNIDYRKKRIWYHLDEYIRSLALSGTEEYQIENMIKKLIENYRPEVLIISESGGGIIPMSKEDNTFREAAGRISVYAAENCEEVYRVICGVKMRIK